MKEKLIIQNFGPINSIDLELGKITILIGEQASGKSTVVKVLAICRYFSYIANTAYLETALRDWGLDGFENNDSYVYYECQDYSFEFKGFGGNDSGFYLETSLKPKSDNFKQLMISFETLMKADGKTYFSAHWEIPHSFLTTDVKRVMNNPFYLPTERGLQSIFSLGKSAIENLDDSLYNQLSSLYSVAKGFKTETEIEPLNISYKNVDGQGYIKEKGEDKYVKLSQAASGYKSAIPIVLAIKNYSEFEKRKKTFIVEEIEQNLFPKAQKQLIEFIVESVNTNNNQFLLPTHSPYILTALENLMYAYKVGKIEGGKYKEDVSLIVEDKYWINPKDVNVYYLANGEHQDLVQREESLIDKEYIDGVSDITNEVFDNLLSIEITHENAAN